MPGRVSSVAALFVLAAVAGCQHSRTVDTHTIVATPARGEMTGRPTLSMPFGLPSRATRVVPYSLESSKGLLEWGDPYSRSGFMGRSAGPSASSPWHVEPWMQAAVRWHNAIFVDSTTGEEWTALEGRGVISRFQVFARPPAGGTAPRSEHLVFFATTADSNGDGRLDDRDASVAYVADGDGRHPRAVTPASAQCWNVSWDPERGRLHLFVVPDTDGDGSYTEDDAGLPYELDPATPGPAHPVVSPAIQERVRAWLR